MDEGFAVWVGQSCEMLGIHAKARKTRLLLKRWYKSKPQS